jgi:hypothetical protein
MTYNVSLVAAAGSVVLAIVVLIAAGTARPVEAVSYSIDGRTWAPRLAEPSSDSNIRWVPGDSRIPQFHIHNATDSDGRVQVVLDSDNPSFTRALSVSIAGHSFGACAQVDVAAGERKRIDATITAAAGAGNDTRASSAAIDLVVEWDDRTTPACSEFLGRGLEQEGAQR